MRRLFLLLISLLTLISFAAPVAAQDIDEVAQSVELRGYYIEDGAQADINELESVVSDAANNGKSVAVVVLAEEAEGGDDLFATNLLETVQGAETVLVLSGIHLGAGNRGIGVRSLDTVYNDATLNAARDHMIESVTDSTTPSQLAATFVEALPIPEGGGAAVPDDDTVPADSSDGPDSTESTTNPATSPNDGGGFPMWLLWIPGIGLVIWLFVRMSKKKARKVDDLDLESARAEIREQMQVIADEILENENTVGLSNNDEAIAYYRAASATYKAVGDKLDATTNLMDLADLSGEVDLARWQMDAAEALVEGRAVPPEPEPEKPAACFFDPTHKPGIEHATVSTTAGSQEIAVCPSCADKLERGEAPKPRTVDVGGRRVPSAKAPKSHGGRGMGGLDTFDIVLGGIGAMAGGRRRGGSPQSMDWGQKIGGQRSSNSSGGVFGADRLPSRRSSGGGTGGNALPGRSSKPRRSGGRTRGRF